MLVATKTGFVRADGAKAFPLSGRAGGVRYSPSRSVDLVGLDRAVSYTKVYASQPWIFSLVNKLCRGIGRIPLRAYEWENEDESLARAVPTSDLGRLVQRPYPRGTRRKLVEAMVGSVAVFGHSYTWKYRPRGPLSTPKELWPLDPRYTEFLSGRDVPIAHYVYRDPTGQLPEKRMLPDDVIHVSWWSPAGEIGTSPLEPLRRTLALEDAGQRYAISSFANAVRPSGALVHPKKLDDDVKLELYAEMDTLHTGPDAAFRMLLLDGGLEWQKFSHTSQEAETILHRKLNREEACAVYDIPPPVVHILDRATFSNIEEQNKALYREALAPWFGAIEGDLWAQLIADETEWAGQFVEFDLRAILRADLEVRADAYVKLLAVYTPNELRAQEGLSKIDHPAADAILLPLNTAPAGPGFDVVEPPTTEERQLAAMLVDAIRDRNGKGERAERIIRELAAAD